MFGMRGGGLRVGCDTERCMLKLRCGFDYMQREGLIKSKGRKKEKQNKGSLYLLGSCNYCLAGPRHRARLDTSHTPIKRNIHTAFLNCLLYHSGLSLAWLVGWRFLILHSWHFLLYTRRWRVLPAACYYFIGGFEADGSRRIEK
jgi:hypothetical protein